MSEERIQLGAGGMRMPSPDNTPTQPVPVRKVLRAMPQTTGYSATRYDTDDQMVLTIWKDGETWDIRIPKARPVPVEEHECWNPKCAHARKFHGPLGCECKCPSFSEPPEEDKTWPRQGRLPSGPPRRDEKVDSSD